VIRSIQLGFTGTFGSTVDSEEAFNLGDSESNDGASTWEETISEVCEARRCCNSRKHCEFFFPCLLLLVLEIWSGDDLRRRRCFAVDIICMNACQH
jgi:hypothetical protein